MSRKRKFKLEDIDEFDARRGYKRCVIPGVGTHVGKRQAIADFWKDRNGNLVVRFSSQGYQYHFKGLLASGRQIPEDQMEEFSEWVSERLLDWIIEGVDDYPEFLY
jgi:hypothetical protein